MSCEELHHYLERDQRVASTSDTLRAEVVEHVAVCHACRSYLEEQEELRANLQLMKDAAPSVPATLDGVVLAKYRRHIRDLARSRELSRKPARTIALTALGWTAAAAFALIVAYGEVGLFTRGEHNRTWGGQQTAARNSTSQVEPEHNSIATQAQTKAPHATNRNTHLAAQQNDQAENDQAEIAAKNALLRPAEFHSLMYCDELSCSGTMEMIRVQVPAEVLGLSLPSVPANEPVSADVLVGPDGIARGIRPAAQEN